MSMWARLETLEDGPETGFYTCVNVGATVHMTYFLTCEKLNLNGKPPRFIL